ncbi:MAG TPA: glycerol-3-phosphate dehydrogenase C-terminal domain-containing protein, partial [Hanamia sp.]|nr:glycerol-3-phosphate dehydrogenase C-terminal domain-containing protein [Hanamia sp.]
MNKIMNNHLLPPKNGSTKNVRIHGYLMEENNLSPLFFYGSDISEIEKLEKENEYFAEPLSDETDITVVQIIWAVRNEMARTVEDVLARRTRVLFCDSKLAIELAPIVAEIMMKELNRDGIWRKKQVDEFIQLAKGYSLHNAFEK